MSIRIRSKQIVLDTGLSVTGSLNVSGSSTFIGQAIFKSDIDQQISLIVSGAMSIIDGYAQNTVQQAKVTIGNLGTLGNNTQTESIDLGAFF